MPARYNNLFHLMLEAVHNRLVIGCKQEVEVVRVELREAHHNLVDHQEEWVGAQLRV